MRMNDAFSGPKLSTSRHVRVFLSGIAHANYLTTEITEHTERVGILNFTLCVLGGLCGLNSVRNLVSQ